MSTIKTTTRIITKIGSKTFGNPKVWSEVVLSFYRSHISFVWINYFKCPFGLPEIIRIANSIKTIDKNLICGGTPVASFWPNGRFGLARPSG